MGLIKYRIEVMQACVGGKRIEAKYKGTDSWFSIENPDFNWSGLSYRVAPETKEEAAHEVSKRMTALFQPESFIYCELEDYKDTIERVFMEGVEWQRSQQ